MEKGKTITVGATRSAWLPGVSQNTLCTAWAGRRRSWLKKLSAICLVLGLGLAAALFLALALRPAAKVQAINNSLTAQGNKPQIQVHFRNHDWVQGRVAAHALVNITLMDSLGQVKGSYSDWAGSDGWFGAWCVRDSNDQCVDIAPGDTVEVVYDGSDPIIVPVIEITGIVDSAANIITGQILTETLPTQGRAEIWTREGAGQDFTTDDAGNYAVDFSPYDVKPGHWVNIWYTYPDGNQVGAVFSELRLEVDVSRDNVNGITDPAQTATVTLRAPDGSVKEEAIGIANADGQFGVDFLKDIAPDDTVEAWAGTRHTSLVVVPVTADVDQAGDKAWGYGPSKSNVSVGVNGDWRETSTDSAGYYEVQYDWDITSNNVEVQYDDPTGHQTRYSFGPSDVRVNKWAPVGNIVPGDEFRYVIDYANDANGLATDVVITDTLPDHVTYVRDTSGVTPTVDPGSNTLVWHMGTLGQRSRTFELWVKLDTAAPQGTQLRNRVEIGDPGDGNPDNNWSETDVQPGDPWVDLWADMSLEAELPSAGEVITYQLRYGNNGNRMARNVVLTDTLPPGTTFVRSTFDVGVDGLAERVGESGVAWEIGTLAPGERREFELAVRIDEGTAPGTLLTNEAGVSGDDEGDPMNNRFRRTTVAGPLAADLWVDQEVKGDLSSIENELIYRITYRNDGTLAAQDVVLTDTLPATMTHLWHSAGSAATLADGTIVWQLGTVPPGGGGQLLVGVRASGTIPAGTVFTHTVEATTSTPELDYDNNLAVTLLGPPRVICVPWAGGLPHRVWSGLSTTLKGTAKGDGLTTFEWHPGDGSPAITGTVGDPYVIEVSHTYNAALGTVYTATLTVWGAFGWSDTDTYVVQVFTPTHGTRVDAAVDEGLWYIHKAAQRYERNGLPFAEWGGGNRVAENVSAVQAFQVQGHRPGGDPWEDPYVEDVQRGWNAIFTYAKPDTMTIQPAGDPDSDGDGIGLGMYDNYGAAIYESGLAMMALATTGVPDRVARTGPPFYVCGQTYYSIAQDVADWFTWGQNDEASGTARGGWRYRPNSGDSDNSNTQFPVLGLAAAEDNWGITVPAWVKDELRDYWLAYTQDSSGGFGYTNPGDWNNVGKAGAGIMDLTWTGVPVTDTRIVRASRFIEQHWDDAPDGNWNGNLGEFYAMYAVKKGSQLAGIHEYGSHAWDNEYAAYLIGVQRPDGSFGDSGNMGGWQPMNTSWAMMILSPGLYEALPVPVIPPILSGGEGPQWAEVQFDASDSHHTDPDREIVLFEWDFGDGSPVVTTTSPINTHTYPTWGDYLATVTVCDDAGNCAIGASQVKITGPGYHPPVADPGGPYSGRAGQEIVLDGSGSSDLDEWMGDSVVLYEWNVAGSRLYTTSEPTLAYSGTVSGTFPVALRVQDQGVGDGPDKPQWSEPATTTLTVSREVPQVGQRTHWRDVALAAGIPVIVVVVSVLVARAATRRRA